MSKNIGYIWISSETLSELCSASLMSIAQARITRLEEKIACIIETTPPKQSLWQRLIQPTLLFEEKLTREQAIDLLKEPAWHGIGSEYTLIMEQSFANQERSVLTLLSACKDSEKVLVDVEALFEIRESL